MGGADFVVDYTQGDWQKEVLKITGGHGVDVVYDPVGRIKGGVLFYLATGLSYNGFIDSTSLCSS